MLARGAFLAATVIFCVVSGSNAQAQECPVGYVYNSAGRCERAGSVTSTDVKTRLNEARLQLRKLPTPSKPPADPDGLLMDINAPDFCADGGLEPLLRQFIDEKSGSIFHSEERAVAFVAKIGFADAADPAVATVPLALIPPKGAKDAQGREIQPVINCQGKILGGLPANQPLTVRLELAYSSDKIVLTPAVQAALNLVGKSLTTASLLGPHTAVAGSGILAFSSGLGEVTKSANEFLALFEQSTDDVPATFRWDAKTRELRYRTSKRFTLTKSYKNTGLHFDPRKIELTLPDAFFRAFGKEKTLDKTYDKAGEQWGALGASPTAANFRAYCKKLNEEAVKAYGSEQAAVALSIYFRLLQQKKIFEPKKQTCLEDFQVQVLKLVGITKPPYDGAFDPKVAAHEDDQEADEESNSVSTAEFLLAKELMTALATAVKNAPARAAEGPKSAKEFRKELLGVFSRDVIATAYGTDLLPNSERGVDSAVIVDYLLKWGDISHFGCFGKPLPPNTRKSSAETLVLFEQRKLLVLAKFTVDPKKEIFTAIDIVKAREEDVTRLLGKRKYCGRIDNKWDPRLDFEKINSEAVAGSRPAVLVSMHR